MENNMLKINKEFQKLIPEISAEEFAGLKENIIKEGCRDDLITWKGTIIDGHNRYKICTEHNIKFQIREKEFPDETEAKIWIINNQFARRNLSPYQRGVLALKLEPLVAKQAKERMSKGGKGVPILAQVKGKTRDHISKSAKISHGTLEKIKEIEIKGTPEQKRKLISGERTVSSVIKDIQQDEIKKGIREIPMPKGNFSIIYADPPWEYQWETRGASAHHYNTESVDKLKKMKIPATENAVMFMWATNPKLNDAIELLNAWGFEYKTNMVWIKDKFGTGYWCRGQHELLLIGTKGKVKTPANHLRPSSVIQAKRTKHSKKPEELYKLIEKMFPKQKYLELFSRNKRDKWTMWGSDSAVPK